jgi:hypothetical protein
LVGKVCRGRNGMHGKVCVGQRPGQIEDPPWWALQQRQHVQPIKPLEHQTGTAVVIHDVDQPGGDAVTVQRGQCRGLRTVPAESGTVQLDHRVIAPRVHLGLPA